MPGCSARQAFWSEKIALNVCILQALLRLLSVVLNDYELSHANQGRLLAMLNVDILPQEEQRAALKRHLKWGRQEKFRVCTTPCHTNKPTFCLPSV